MNTNLETKDYKTKEYIELKKMIRDKKPIELINNESFKTIYHKVLSECDLYKNENKLWGSLLNLIADVEEIEELKQLPKGTKIYPMYNGDIRSSYTGNHAKIKLFRPAINKHTNQMEIRSVTLWCMGLNERTLSYHQHGGNYSFTFDLVYRLGMLVFKNGYYFTEGKTLE